MRYVIGLFLFCLLGACSGPDQFIASPKLVAQERISSKFRTIEVVEVSLPSYAARDEITAQENGLLVLSDVLWADDPTRSMTLTLTRHLSELTRVRVASEPWPFDGYAAGRVEVRVEELIVTADAVRLAGQYYVVDLDGLGRDHAHLFDLSTTIKGSDAVAVAQGRARLMLNLAKMIARDGL